MHDAAQRPLSWDTAASVSFNLLLTDCCGTVPYVMQSMQALPCPKGTYKESISRATSCTPCPRGISTAGVSSASFTACDRATPGYKPLRINDSLVAVEPCPVGTYGPDGLRCVNCTDGLTTQNSARTAPTDCLAAPGYGFYKDGSGDDSPISTADLVTAGSKVIKCPAGSYKVSDRRPRCIMAFSLMPCSRSPYTTHLLIKTTCFALIMF